MFDTPFNPALGWTFYRIPILETAGWRKDTTNGPVASQGELLHVLADLTDLRIRAGYSSAAEVDSIDNVRMLAPACATNAILVPRPFGDNIVQFEWPANACGFSLETADILAPASWGAASLPTVQTNGFNRVSVTPTGTTRFFRLVHQ